MRKSLLYTLFGVGRLPKKARPHIESEGIVLLDEGLRGLAVLRNFRAPGRRHSYRASWFVGSIVMTGSRFAAFTLWRPIINVPVHDDRLSLLRLSLRRENYLSVAFDAAAFHSDWSGSVEFRFHTALAREIIERVASCRPPA